jgi:hypothetical protein
VVKVSGSPVLVKETDLAILQDRLFRREGIKGIVSRDDFFLKVLKIETVLFE